METRVTIQPSGHRFVAEAEETLLQAGLKAGLALPYGCSNGACGMCRARRISGKTAAVKHADYVFKAAEKAQGYVLTCAHAAASPEVVLEVPEAGGAGEIAQQQIQIRLKKIERPVEDVLIVRAQTPRSQRFRFLAGQAAKLSLAGAGGATLSRTLSLASCPCDDRNLEFHIPRLMHDKFFEALSAGEAGLKHLDLTGPSGDFVLPGDISGGLIFIAEETGFAPVRSLIEHAMSLDEDVAMRLYWLAARPEGHYLANLCRSWSDALDDFQFLPLPGAARATLARRIGQSGADLATAGVYVAGGEELSAALKPQLAGLGLPAQNWHFTGT